MLTISMLSTRKTGRKTMIHLARSQWHHSVLLPCDYNPQQTNLCQCSYMLLHLLSHLKDVMHKMKEQKHIYWHLWTLRTTFNLSGKSYLSPGDIHINPSGFERLAEVWSEALQLGHIGLVWCDGERLNVGVFLCVRKNTVLMASSGWVEKCQM